VATSGDYRNYFEADGQRYSHTIDPRTGYPVAHELVSVTVVHPSAMMADAWATALTVLGPDEALAVAQEQGLAVYFIQRDGEEFVHSHSAAFQQYLHVPAQ
jgi:thiamine biosynthesis lipoprotein